MSEVATKQDLQEGLQALEKRSNARMDKFDDRIDKLDAKIDAVDTKLDHAVEVLEKKIARSEASLKAYIDEAVDKITSAIASALHHVPTREQFDQLERRVSQLEQHPR